MFWTLWAIVFVLQRDILYFTIHQCGSKFITVNGPTKINWKKHKLCQNKVYKYIFLINKLQLLNALLTKSLGNASINSAKFPPVKEHRCASLWQQKDTRWRYLAETAQEIASVLSAESRACAARRDFWKKGEGTLRCVAPIPLIKSATPAVRRQRLILIRNELTSADFNLSLSLLPPPHRVFAPQRVLYFSLFLSQRRAHASGKNARKGTRDDFGATQTGWIYMHATRSFVNLPR